MGSLTRTAMKFPALIVKYELRGRLTLLHQSEAPVHVQNGD